MHARASVERRSRETRETRAAAWEEKRASPVSRHQSRAWSFACLGRFARRTKKKERLLVVYAWVSKNLKVMGSSHAFEKILKFSAFSLSLEWTLRDDRCTHEKRHTNYINNRGGSRNFLLGGGGSKLWFRKDCWTFLWQITSPPHPFPSVAVARYNSLSLCS